METINNNSYLLKDDNDNTIDPKKYMMEVLIKLLSMDSKQAELNCILQGMILNKYSFSEKIDILTSLKSLDQDGLDFITLAIYNASRNRKFMNIDGKNIEDFIKYSEYAQYFISDEELSYKENIQKICHSAYDGSFFGLYKRLANNALFDDTIIEEAINGRLDINILNHMEKLLQQEDDVLSISSLITEVKDIMGISR